MLELNSDSSESPKPNNQKQSFDMFDSCIETKREKA